MKYTLNGISHFDFFEGLEVFFSETSRLLEVDHSDIDKLKEESDRLIDRTEKFISEYIQPNSEKIHDLLKNFYDTGSYYDFSFYELQKDSELIEELRRLNRFGRNLRLTIGYLSITETLLNAERHILIESISGKTDFILSRLNSVFGDETYSIQKILDFNDVKFRVEETREIAEDLAQRGYVILKEKYGTSDEVKISVKGARYIERKLKKGAFQKERNELDNKLDVIIEQLVRLGYGQEIIFNEIDELRELQHKLSKKSWSQLLKGKLVDLALDKLITTEVAKSVYEYLTSNNFKLLK